MIIKFYSKLLMNIRELSGNSYDQYVYGEGDDYEDDIKELLASDPYNDDLAQYADKEYNGFDTSEVMSITMTLEGDFLVATCVLTEDATPDMVIHGKNGDSTLKEALADYLEGQYADGWGEGLEQESLGTDYIEDEYADPSDYADEDGEIPDDWEDMVDDIEVYYSVSPWWSSRESFLGKFEFSKVEVLD